MATILLKPRWADWENVCLQKAFAEKIQYKVMALALGKTVSAISKKIKKLGLRPATTIRGRVKGMRQALPWITKTPHDIERMVEILKDYAPLICFQEGKLALEKNFWPVRQQPLYLQKNKAKLMCSIDLYSAPFSYRCPLDYSTLEVSLPHLIKVKDSSKEAAYISLCHVEQWADAKGFRKTTGTLEQRGLPYWKDGAYFSQTQLLMYLNRLRFERHLQPVALIEAEREPLV